MSAQHRQVGFLCSGNDILAGNVANAQSVRMQLVPVAIISRASQVILTRVKEIFLPQQVHS